MNLSSVMANASPAMIRMNPGVFGNREIKEKASNSITNAVGETVRKQMDKTEAEFYHALLAQIPGNRKDLVFIQPSRFFPLVGGGTYTPDFLYFNPEPENGVFVIEIKGGYGGGGWEQGYERYKRTATLFDNNIFHFVMYTKGKGTWKRQIWNPEVSSSLYPLI